MYRSIKQEKRLPSQDPSNSLLTSYHYYNLMCILFRFFFFFFFLLPWLYKHMGFPGGASVKELTCQCRRHERLRFDP